MNDVHLVRLAERQHRCVAVRQLHALGYSDEGIAGRAWLEPICDGVYAVGPVGDDDRTRWMAATLTAPGTVLAMHSAGAAWGVWDRPVPLITVVRPGSGGPEELDGVLVHRSIRLDGETTELDGIPITTAERTVIDLAARVWPDQIGRLVREAIRREATSIDALFAAMRRHTGRRGIARLNVAASRYAGIPIRRTRSDAEALALTILHEADRAPDAHNLLIEGEEADLIWFGPRRIIELDGPQFHLDGAHDRAKQRHWERHGWEVHRLPTDDVYLAPHRLLTLAERR
jgi:very-short-patch-repair endonuclease